MSSKEATEHGAEYGAAGKARGLKRFWIGWGSKLSGVETGFVKWTIRANRMPFTDDLIYSYAAVVDAVDRESAWQRVVESFVDADESFVKEKPRDYWPPADRFARPS
jgi:hypothetical protein